MTKSNLGENGFMTIHSPKLHLNMGLRDGGPDSRTLGNWPCCIRSQEGKDYEYSHSTSSFILTHSRPKT